MTDPIVMIQDSLTVEFHVDTFGYSGFGMKAAGGAMRIWARQFVGFVAMALVAAVGLSKLSTSSTSSAKTPSNIRSTLRLASFQGAPISAEHGQDIYSQRCAVCHKADRTGTPPLGPTLIGINKKYADDAIAHLIKAGKGRMPAYADMPDEDVQSLILFLKTEPPADNAATGETLALFQAHNL